MGTSLVARYFTRRLVLLAFVVLLSLSQISYQFYGPRPTCHGLTERDRYCIYENVCVNEHLGLFVVGVEPRGGVPPANIRAADSDWDEFFVPRYLSGGPLFRDYQTVWYDRTLIYGRPYSPDHMTHYLVNAVLPAIDIRRRLQQQHPEWGSHYDLMMPFPHGPDGSAPDDIWGFDEVVRGDEYLKHPLVKGNKFSCYPRAVFGLNNTCPFYYCDHNHDHELYAEVRRMLWEHCDLRPSTTSKYHSPLIHVIQRRNTRKILNLDTLVSYLEQYGTVGVFELEEMSFCEQAMVFFEADVLVAAHGNSLGHVLWMRDRTMVIELIQNGWISPFFQSLAKQTGFALAFTQIVCKSPSCFPPEQEDMVPKDRSVIVTEELLDQVGEALMQKYKKIRV